MAMALIGTIILWCCYPILLMAATLETTTSTFIIAGSAQVNIWLALATGVLGVLSANSIYYQKMSVHDIVFFSITVLIEVSLGSYCFFVG